MEGPRIDDDGFAGPDADPGADGAPGREPRASMFIQASIVDVATGESYPLRVRNISSGGLMAECPHPFASGDRVELELRGVGQQSGKIAWAAEGRFGVSFDHPINPQLARRPVKAPDARPSQSAASGHWRPGLRIR